MNDPQFLPVMESFYTIQGEGYFSGTPAYFIRLGGCDVGCHWCDVKESWDASKFEWIATEKIVEEVRQSAAEIAVITGGEPLMYDLSDLTDLLHHAGVKTNIETSGAHELSGNWDWLCFSPKKFKKPLPSILEKVNELKVVIYNKSDFEWAEEYRNQVGPSTHLYLQPEWSREKEMIPLIVEYVKRNPKWKISLQTHKYMEVP
jgi:organic radical activating enzyme